MTENVIPISKSQEKVAFLAGKLDWNENGEFREEIGKFHSNLNLESEKMDQSILI